MRRFIVFVFLIITTNCFGQAGEKFVIKELVQQDTVSAIGRNAANPSRDYIYEDSLYVVTKSCSGEWGGSVTFKNKKTGIEHSAASTCPVAVNKLNGKYYVTNTLAHMSGFSEVLEIDNPDSMAVFEWPEPRGKKGKTIIRYAGDQQSKSTKGTKQLVDTIGVLTIASFMYENHLYHIVTDFQKTFITQIENNKFVTIATISDKSLWTYDPEVVVTATNHLIVRFDNEQVKGHLDIFENQITIIRKQ